MNTATPVSTPPVSPPGRGYAVASLILGIIPVVPVAGSVIAIILGHLSRKDSKRAGLKGSAMATWGIILGWLSIAVTVIVIIIIVIAAAKTSTSVPTEQPTGIWSACHTADPPPYCLSS